MKHLLKEPGLVKLFQQAELYQALLDLGRSNLPTDLAPHLTGISIDQNKLVCLTQHAVWASKLRFFEQTLLHDFTTHLPHLKLNQVVFKVVADEQKPAVKKRTVQPPDLQAARQMKVLSEQLENKKLAQALLRLSQRAESDS